MLRRLLRPRDLSLADLLLLPQLILSALALRSCLRMVSLPRLTRLLARGAQTTRLRRLPFLHGRRDIERLARLADLATRLTHGRGRCLPRSLLLFWLLKTREEPVELLVGVQRESGSLEGHAWIERRGALFGDSPGLTGRYAALLRF